MELQLEFVAQATGGKICLPEGSSPTGIGHAGREPVCSGVSIDSRTLEPGQLFVPIVADSNGHNYIRAAWEAGAAGYLTDETPLGLPIPAVLVADTQKALAALAKAARATPRVADTNAPADHTLIAPTITDAAPAPADLSPDGIVGIWAHPTITDAAPAPADPTCPDTTVALSPTVIGITGSVGKTTTKDFLSQVLSSKLVCFASQKSFNNHLGVPLTILNAPDGYEALVVEMGASAVGEIAFLCEIARPSYGVLTSIAAAHMKGFGSLENLCRAKGELLEALPEDGVAVLNRDSQLVMSQKSRTSASTILTFGLSPQANVSAEDVSMTNLCYPRYRLKSPWGDAQVSLGVPGAHNVLNSLAAATVALNLGFSPEQVAIQLEQAQLSPWRMDLQKANRGFWVLNDSYNANPASTVAALRTLAELPAKRKIAVLGTMAELGDFHLQAHEETAKLAADLGVELITIGEPAYGIPTEPDQASVMKRLTDLQADDAVLVKASRSAGLEVLAQNLLDL